MTIAAWQRGVLVLAAFLVAGGARAQGPGDVNNDGVVDVRDLVRINAALANSLSPPPADANSDGATNVDDASYALDVVRVGAPLTTAFTSPLDGEVGVAVTREFIVELSYPLAPATVVAPNRFFLTLGGQALATRNQISTNRRRISLFPESPLPPEAEVVATLDASGLVDKAGTDVDIDGDGAPGGLLRTRYRTLALAVVANSRVCGRVFASDMATAKTGLKINQPLRNVKVWVDGAEDAVFDFSGDMGDFCIDPAPTGVFFVHIDGRTADGVSPPGAYYPSVGKSWEGRAAQTINIGDVYLPKVVPNTLQPVSETQSTIIEFPPEVQAQDPTFLDVAITVPPATLFSDDGVRGGSVGIAPVAPDRIPSPLPPGLEFPIVITVQTDGPTNFDQPAPVCLPNMANGPRPPLSPGGKTALWSFDHDTGHWVIAGPATATPSGQLICSDPGVGIRTPGWHGSFASGSASGGDEYSGGDSDSDYEPQECTTADCKCQISGPSRTLVCGKPASQPDVDAAKVIIDALSVADAIKRAVLRVPYSTNPALQRYKVADTAQATGPDG